MKCRACAFEAEHGTQEVPHPVDPRVHDCVERSNALLDGMVALESIDAAVAFTAVEWEFPTEALACSSTTSRADSWAEQEKKT
jgi:hypothetical protein